MGCPFLSMLGGSNLVSWKSLLEQLAGEFIEYFNKRNGKLPHCKKRNLHPELCSYDGLTHRRDVSAILATRSQTGWKRR